MRIGFVTGEYMPMQGGVGSHCRHLTREMLAMGHEVFIYTDARAVEPDLPAKLTHNTGGWGLGALWRIRRWAIDNQLTVVNFNFQTAAYQMSPFIHWLPDVLPMPVVTTFHDLRFPYLFPKAGALRDYVVMRLARASAAIISTNHEDYANLSHLPNVTLIPIGSNVHGAPPADFNRERYRASLSASPDDFVIAHFGFINHTKGVDVLLRAAKALGSSVKIWLIGGRVGASDPTNVAYSEGIVQLISELGMTENVVWTGFLEEAELGETFAACDIVAQLFNDGASYRRSTLLAAVQHGCATLTTAPVVDIPTFQDGVNMRLVPIGDVDAVAAALIELREDAGLRERLKTGAIALRDKFAWGDIARETVAFFAQITDRSS